MPTFLEADRYDIIHDHSGCPELNYVGTIYNAIQVGAYPFREEKDDYALFLGRICEDKGVHNAIDAAQRTGIPLRIAGKVAPGADTLYFDKRIKPHVDGENIIFEGKR